MADRTVSVALKAKVDGFVAGVKTAGLSVKEFSGSLDKLGQQHKEKFADLTTGMAAVGVGMAGAFALIAKSTLDFDKEMSAVASVSDASGASLERLRQAAINAGQATTYSATEAAQAEEELAKAGVSTADILGGGLTGALSLAAAGSLSLSDAAEDAAKAMNVFQLQGKDVGHIADVLASGANTSATDVEHLAQALGQGGQVAAQTGLTLEQTVGTLAAFAQRGMQGSDAGTSLKTMLQALANPSQQTADLMRQLGINAYDAQGSFIGITNLAQMLQDKLSGLSQKERDAAMAQIFGSDAVRSATTLYQLGAKGLQGYIDGVNQVGAAQDTASKKMDNLSGDIERLKGSLETLTISSGEGVSGGLRQMAQAADRVVTSVSQLPSGLQTTMTLMAGLGGASLLAGAGVLKARQKLGEMQETLSTMGPAGARASTALGKVSSVVGKVTLAIVALQAASAALGHDVDPSVEATSNALVKLGQTGQASGEALSHLSYDLGTLGSSAMVKIGNGVAGFIEAISGAGSIADESLYHAKERISAIDEGLAALASGGHTDEATAAFNKLAEQAKKSGISIDDLKKGLPQYTAVLDGATASEKKNVEVTANAKSKTDALSGSVKDAVDRYGSFKDMIDSINGNYESSIKATLDAKQAIDDLRGSLKENGNTFDLNAQKGRDNTSAMLKVADAARDAAEAKYAETGSVDAATKVYNDYKDQLVKTLVKTGMMQAAAKQYVDQLMKIPPNISTTVTLNANTQKMLNDVKRAMRMAQRIASGQLPFASGGVAIPSAATGAIYPASDPPLLKFAEPQTHGEALIPRAGIPDSVGLALANTAAGWHGGRVVRAGDGAEMVTVQNDVRVNLDGQPFYAMTVEAQREAAWRSRRR